MGPGLFSCLGLKNSKKPSPVLPTIKSKNQEKESSPPEVDQTVHGAVLVELFSSQGCATSQQAEMMVSRIGRGDFELDVPVILLAFHVDYWDHLGWKDPYGSNQWTVRQKSYVEALEVDTLFTPHVVVQGRVQCLGNDQDDVLYNITSAIRFPGPAFKATFQRTPPDSLQVTLTGPLRIIVDNDSADVMVALYENSLVTDCPEGENKGRILSSDYAVRSLKKMCTVREISAEKILIGSVTFGLWEGFNSGKCGVVVFVQNKSLQILGSQNISEMENV
ncbi:hypothetical protein IFM89_011393 [Coptis chinensis]|uniref:Uncharacterized protein n=1 Tax=Coptis chinensis TaxID=261450 RepID=A0A835I336_9MAGN|nr:hypothetical protein IFM89_011393 [Coptis chinensis]